MKSKHRLDRPDREKRLREDNKARKVIFDALYRNPPYNQGVIASEILDGLEKLALFDEEEIRKQERARIFNKIEPFMQNMGGRDTKPQMWIMINKRDWQALKEE